MSHDNLISDRIEDAFLYDLRGVCLVADQVVEVMRLVCAKGIQFLWVLWVL